MILNLLINAGDILFNFFSSHVAITLNDLFILIFCSFLFGFSGTSKYKSFSDFKFKSNKLLALSVT